MILKELNNYRDVEVLANLPIHEFNFLKAYLVIIDEVNKADHNDIDFSSLDKINSSTKYKLLWLPTIRQFEYNDKGNFIFDTLKLVCMLKYAMGAYPLYLKEYLESFNLKSPGELLSSYNQIFDITQSYDTNAAPLPRASRPWHACLVTR